MRPENSQVDCILSNIPEVCRDTYFHPFKHKCVYDFKIKNIRSNYQVILKITHKYMKFRAEN